jgi:dTDP-L-rhamnose 4-epimerase
VKIAAAAEEAMEILVTGGAGFIGSHLAERLLALGARVTLFDSLDPQAHPGGEPPWRPAAARLVIADVLDREPLRRALADADAVVHCAAAVGVAQSLYRPHAFVNTNVAGTALLLELLAERRQSLTRLVLLSSNTEYGEGLYRRPSDRRLVRVAVRTEAEIRRRGWEPACPDTGEPLEPVPTPESAELMGVNPYALTKKYQEELALSLGATHGLPVTCLRLFNVYGPRQSLANPYTGVLAIFLARLLAGRAPVVYEDGRQSRDFVSVHDVAAAVATVIEHPGLAGEVINVATGESRRIADCARDLALCLGTGIAPEISGSFRSGDVRHCIADITRARERLGYEPRVSWEAGLAELVEWARAAPSADHFQRAEGEMARRGLLTPIARPARR